MTAVAASTVAAGTRVGSVSGAQAAAAIKNAPKTARVVLRFNKVGSSIWEFRGIVFRPFATSKSDAQRHVGQIFKAGWIDGRSPYNL